VFLTCAWEVVVAVLVEGAGHDPVCQVEGLLDTVTVVDVYVQVQHTRVISAAAMRPFIKTVSVNCIDLVYCKYISFKFQGVMYDV